MSKNSRDREYEIVKEVQTQLNIRYYPKSRAEQADEIQNAQAEKTNKQIIEDFNRFYSKYSPKVISDSELRKLLSNHLASKSK